MEPHDDRACFSRLLKLTDGLERSDHDHVIGVIDSVLACERRSRCGNTLGCSWVATEIAGGLVRRYR